MMLMVGHLLERLGYRATCFCDPAAALDVVQAHPGEYDVVVTDYKMPPMSGLDVARVLRSVEPGLPVVISSGFISDELRLAAAELDVFEVMRKESTLEDLGALLSRALRRGDLGSRPAGGRLPEQQPAAA